MSVLALRLKSSAQRNMRRVALNIGLKSSLACGLVHCLKEGAKRLARRHERLGRVVNFVCDVLLPITLYGPLIGVVLEANSILNEQERDWKREQLDAAKKSSDK